MIMGPLRGRDYVDKSILDLWFLLGRESTDEYKCAEAGGMANGTAGLDIGAFSRLCIERDDRIWRSVSLPFTIGLELDRDAPSERPRLVIRDNDIAGLGLHGHAPGNNVRAASIGFARLLWYDLLMTAYFDSIDMIDPVDKRILMVFYDMDDIPLEELGMSGRMWEAIDHHRRASHFNRRLEYLSDLLGWLSTRGFNIRICVNHQQSHNERVRRLFSRLRSFDSTGQQIVLTTKDIPRASMHVKGILTPLGAIDGSTNLTRSGISRNEEFVNHANVGSNDYKNIETGLMDVLRKAVPWNG